MLIDTDAAGNFPHVHRAGETHSAAFYAGGFAERPDRVHTYFVARNHCHRHEGADQREKYHSENRRDDARRMVAACQRRLRVGLRGRGDNSAAAPVYVECEAIVQPREMLDQQRTMKFRGLV